MERKVRSIKEGRRGKIEVIRRVEKIERSRGKSKVRRRGKIEKRG